MSFEDVKINFTETGADIRATTELGHSKCSLNITRHPELEMYVTEVSTELDGMASRTVSKVKRMISPANTAKVKGL